LAWLEARAAASGSRVGSVNRAIVRAAMELEKSRGPAALETAGAVGRVRGGAAPVSPSGAAPARLVRLEVVVARLLRPGAGPIAPVDLVAARRRIASGGVDVSGRGAGELEPGLLVGAGEVVLR
jgi:hypothetical protein